MSYGVEREIGSLSLGGGVGLGYLISVGYYELR